MGFCPWRRPWWSHCIKKANTRSDQKPHRRRVRLKDHTWRREHGCSSVLPIYWKLIGSQDTVEWLYSVPSDSAAPRNVRLQHADGSVPLLSQHLKYHRLRRLALCYLRKQKRAMTCTLFRVVLIRPTVHVIDVLLITVLNVLTHTRFAYLGSNHSG